jgi:dolichol-phosphate mannosyltransferase/undecaprenyl-phosphate 4-deoxy-4-formamido-L-arabinose transferase
MSASAAVRDDEPKRTSKISVVVPVYRSEQSLAELVSGLVDVLGAMERPFEIVLVDDCSPDNSWRELVRLREKFGKVVRPARLLTNSGQHNAILCGFSLVTGDVVVTMDDDLQNPPDQVPLLVAAIDQGYDLAIGAYERKMHDRVANTKGRTIDWLQRRMFSLPSTFQLTSFRAIRRSVVDAVNQMGGSYPYITSMLLSNVSKYVNVPVRHEPRKFGASNYNFRRGISLAANLLLSYSTYPVIFVAIVCAITFLISMSYGAWVVYSYIRYGTSMAGWASIVVAMSFFNGMILLCLFIQSVYLSRLNTQLTRSRHAYRIGELPE